MPTIVGKYLLIVLIVMVMGMVFSAMGGLETLQSIAMFYGHLAGALIVIVYYSYSGRKKRQNERKRK